jgi:hypothetical protein
MQKLILKRGIIRFHLEVQRKKMKKEYNGKKMDERVTIITPSLTTTHPNYGFTSTTSRGDATERDPLLMN